LASPIRPTLDDAPAIREAAASDAEALAGFRCSTGRWFQDEVEAFINAELRQRLRAAQARVLLFHVATELVVVAAHQSATLVIAEDPGEVHAAHLLVLAITPRLHTAVLREGDRLSDYAMRVLLSDALHSHDTDVAFAIVAIENQRSLAMCERNGLSSQTIIDRRYARATGRFVSAR
jgi:hypothetical protein